MNAKPFSATTAIAAAEHGNLGVTVPGRRRRNSRCQWSVGPWLLPDDLNSAGSERSGHGGRLGALLINGKVVRF
ncbi:MAG TPA: hypothetical protein DCY13_15920 [Verrucomicrobiales bacterium]|nr:hypothetical protein [Verrucomicrobiales bacterium]